jgi:hypothetical protein
MARRGVVPFSFPLPYLVINLIVYTYTLHLLLIIMSATAKRDTLRTGTIFSPPLKFLFQGKKNGQKHTTAGIR